VKRHQNAHGGRALPGPGEGAYSAPQAPSSSWIEGVVVEVEASRKVTRQRESRRRNAERWEGKGGGKGGERRWGWEEDDTVTPYQQFVDRPLHQACPCGAGEADLLINPGTSSDS